MVRKVMVRHNAHEEVIRLEGKWTNVPEIKVFGARIRSSQDSLGRVYITILSKITEEGKEEETFYSRLKKYREIQN